MNKASGAPKIGDALIIVDVQRDFLPGGALAVDIGDLILGPLNDCLRKFGKGRLPIFASRDWNPADHCSFSDRGGRGPGHCVAEGARITGTREWDP